MVTGINFLLRDKTYATQANTQVTTKNTLENLKNIKMIVERNLVPVDREIIELSLDKRKEFLLEQAVLLKKNYISVKKANALEGLISSKSTKTVKEIDELINDISYLLNKEDRVATPISASSTPTSEEYLVSEETTHLRKLPKDVLTHVLYPYVTSGSKDANKSFAAISTRNANIVYKQAQQMGYKGPSEDAPIFIHKVMSGWKNITVFCRDYWSLPAQIMQFSERRNFSVKSFMELKELVKSDKDVSENLVDLLKTLARGAYLLYKPPSSVMVNNNMVFSLLTLGVSPITEVDSFSPQTVLHLAAGSNFNDMSDVVKMLLEAGAKESINQLNVSNYTPLMSACSIENIDSARYLLNAGADVNFKNANGMTALDLAIISGNEALIKLLLEYKANYKDLNQDMQRNIHFKNALASLREDNKRPLSPPR